MSEIKVNELLAQLRATTGLAQGSSAGPTVGPSTVDFSTTLKSAVDKVNQSQHTAAGLAEAFEVGDPKASLAEVMLALQKANVSFQAMTQVRNKLLAAYQEIMNMQV